MTAMTRPARWGTIAMIALFTGAIGYNVFFIQSALRRQADAGVIVRPDRLGKLVAITEAQEPGRLVRVSVRPKGVRNVPGNAAYAALVLKAQRELAALGLYKGPLDGRYGRATRNAILAYQRKVDLPPTGRPDQKTIDHLIYDRQLANAARFTASLPQAPEMARKVRFVQRRLAMLGYAPGPADGKLGEKTRKAIRLYQADRGMPVTGEVDARLLAALK